MSIYIVDKISAFVKPKITNNPHFLEKPYSDGKNPNNHRKNCYSQNVVFGNRALITINIQLVTKGRLARFNGVVDCPEH
jgi:hypothetical protein